jgi:cyclohexanecarboxyl-CoA dehydrogenase
MDFALTPIQTQYRDAARAFAQQRLAPEYQAREQRGSIEQEIRHGLGQLGLIAPEIPVQLGG